MERDGERLRAELPPRHASGSKECCLICLQGFFLGTHSRNPLTHFLLQLWLAVSILLQYSDYCPPSTDCCQSQCPLGRWLHKTLGNTLSVLEHHRGSVRGLISSPSVVGGAGIGKKELCQSKMDCSLHQASRRVTNILKRLHK